jgi:hypothetical protein
MSISMLLLSTINALLLLLLLLLLQTINALLLLLLSLLLLQTISV